MKRDFVKFGITARALMDVLGFGFYDASAALWELVRNAACAQMSDPKVWQPGVGKVEVMLETNCPLAGADQVLVVLDHGRGFTDVDLERFSNLGASASDVLANPSGGYGGASQKRVGRFAALALNRRCLLENDTTTGFFVVSRTTKAGPVTLIRVVPAEIEQYQALPVSTVSPDDPSLGFLAGKTGTFTAVIIPHPVLESPRDFEEKANLEWRLPREKGKSFDLVVCGRKVSPPPLANKVNMTVGGVRVHLARKALKDDPGLYLTDAGSGLRVTPAWMVTLPFPYNSPEITGDIFIPGLLANQDSSRRGIRDSFLKGGEWQASMRLLSTKSREVAVMLGIEKDDVSSPVREAISSVAQLFNDSFGAPELLVQSSDYFGQSISAGAPKKTDPKAGADRQLGETISSAARPDKKSTPGEGRLIKAIAVRIGDTSYKLVPGALDPRVFAEVQGDTIFVNERGGYVLPTVAAVRQEHIIMCLLYAASRTHCGTVEEAIRWVGEQRLRVKKK